jgi:hypothetical protein
LKEESRMKRDFGGGEGREEAVSGVVMGGVGVELVEEVRRRKEEPDAVKEESAAARAGRLGILDGPGGIANGLVCRK